jgi:hypothetical protein
MKESLVKIRTPDGMMRAFTTHPEEGGRRVATVLAQPVYARNFPPTKFKP